MEFIIKNNSNLQQNLNCSTSLALQGDEKMNNYTVKRIQRQSSKVIDSKKRWSKEENLLLLNLYSIHGAKWDIISKFFTERSAFSVKNHFYGLSKTMTLDKKMELRKLRIECKEQKSIQIFNYVTLNKSTKSEEDLLVESFFVDELKSLDKMEQCEKLNNINSDIEYESFEAQDTIREKLNEKYEELKKLSAILEKQILLKRAKIGLIPKTVC
ncbi:unnamed protein product [Blepharisma stoltei]|uniref:Myb-like domain-containing protein n=1 Tax=Blepharisma stoltei TaxID=1481888 RepID=A0AAU9IFY9_9CILI|nr:unnamed protein product [Blepharisma stoltei]